MEEDFLEIKVEVGYPEIALFKHPTRINFSDSSEQLSYCSVMVKLVKTNEEDSKQEVIVTLFGYFFDMEYMYNYGQSIFDAFDMISGDTCELYNILFDRNGFIKDEYQSQNFCDNVFYIDSLYVKNEYRNRGYAKLILNQIGEIIKYIAKLNIGIVALCAQPFERDDNREKIIIDNKELKRKLIELYKSTGFKETDNPYDYLVKVFEG